MALQVRRGTYRGKDGFYLRGNGGRVSIFFENETAARRTAEKLRNDPNYQTTVTDFEERV